MHEQDRIALLKDCLSPGGADLAAFSLVYHAAKDGIVSSPLSTAPEKGRAGHRQPDTGKRWHGRFPGSAKVEAARGGCGSAHTMSGRDLPHPWIQLHPLSSLAYKALV